MAFPTVGASNKGNETTNGTSSALNVPASPSVGDRILMFVADDQNFLCAFPAGWTQVGSVSNGTTVSGEVYYRDWTGSESNDQGADGTVNVTHTSNMTSHVSVIIGAGTYDTGTAPSTPSSVTGTSANPNCPSHNPTGWDTPEETLYIAAYFWDNGTVSTNSSYPSGYTAINTDSGANTQGCGLAVSWKQSTAASDDPGTGTISNSRPGVWLTLAIRPAAAVAMHARGKVNQLPLASKLGALVR